MSPRVPALLGAASILTACVVQSPPVVGLPGPGKTPTTFQQDESACELDASKAAYASAAQPAGQPPVGTREGNEAAWQRYEAGYTQCMVAHGDTVQPVPSDGYPGYGYGYGAPYDPGFDYGYGGFYPGFYDGFYDGFGFPYGGFGFDLAYGGFGYGRRSGRLRSGRLRSGRLWSGRVFGRFWRSWRFRRRRLWLSRRRRGTPVGKQSFFDGALC